MLKKTILSGLLLAAATGASSAADLPTRKSAPAPYMAPPAYSWTGFYIGLNAGGAFSSGGNSVTTGTPGFLGLIPAGLAPSSLSTNDTGFIGGGQAGYNIQAGAFVYGLEADIDYTDLKKSSAFTSTATVLGSTLTTSATHDLDFLGTVRARLGFTPVDRLLVFATGGFAYGGVKSAGSVVANAAPAINWNGSSSDVGVGFAIGGGAEYAFTNNISLKAEYLYYDLGRKSVYAAGDATVRSVAALNGIDYSLKTRTDGSLVRVGVNYKF